MDRVLRGLAEELVRHSPELAALLVAAGLVAEDSASAIEYLPGLPA